MQQTVARVMLRQGKKKLPPAQKNSRQKNYLLENKIFPFAFFKNNRNKNYVWNLTSSINRIGNIRHNMLQFYEIIGVVCLIKIEVGIDGI